MKVQYGIAVALVLTAGVIAVLRVQAGSSASGSIDSGESGSSDRSASQQPDRSVDSGSDKLNKSLATRIKNRVRDELLGLPVSERPNDRETDALSETVSDYIMFQRTATLGMLLEAYEKRDIEPRPELVQADQTLAENAWLKSAVWARNEEVRIDTIEMRTLFHDGRLEGQLWDGVGPINSRRMSNGKFLHEDSAGFTVYEMRIKSTVQVRLGGTELEATVAVLFIDDGPRGEWSAISSALLDIPAGTRILPPYPVE